MDIIGVIPARYKSTRLPGKPLADIHGKPMIWWVYQQAKKVDELDEVYVATEDKRIKEVCEKYNMEVVLTSEGHATGTDRVAEVAQRISADVYINIQGDEPLIDPEIIRQAIKPFLSNKRLQVTNLMSKITDPVDVVNPTIPKVITNTSNEGIFLTRSACPSPKNALDVEYFKQVCVYGFTQEALKFFAETPRGKIELIEDIEILRYIENHKRVQFIQVESDNVAVDTPSDLTKVRKIMENTVSANE